jgi:hypothetical protein
MVWQLLSLSILSPEIVELYYKTCLLPRRTPIVFFRCFLYYDKVLTIFNPCHSIAVAGGVLGYFVISFNIHFISCFCSAPHCLSGLELLLFVVCPLRVLYPVLCSRCWRKEKLRTVGKKSIHTPCFLLMPFYCIEKIYIDDAFIKNVYWWRVNITSKIS